MSGRKTSLKDRSLIVAILLILAGGTAGEFLYFQGRARRPVYTDGLTTIHEGHLEAERIVLWEEPVGVFSETTTPDEESGPAMDGSGDVLLYAVGAPGTGTELWMAERVEGLTGGTWRRRRLHEVSSPADELCPFLSRDGRYLYFSSNRPGGHGGYDVYMAAREGKGFLPPLNLGPDVNSAGDDLDPTLSPTGDRLLFASDRKRPGREMLSLFSVDRIMGRWMKPRYLAAVSSSAVDRAPEIGPDGKTLFFASNRPGGSGGLDLYKSVFFNDVWLPPAPVTSLNTPRDETDPAVSAEGFTLLFSTSPGDLKMSHTRELFCWSADRDRALTLFGSLMLCLLILLLVIYLARRWAEMGILGRCVVTSLIVHAILFLYFNEVMVQGEVSLAGKQKGRYRISMLPGRARVLPGQRAFEKARGDQVKAVAQAAAPRVARAVADSPRPDSHRPGLADHGLATSRRVRPRPRMKPHRPKGPAPLQRPEADRLPRPDDPRRRRRRPLEHRERAAARVPHASPAAREPAPSPTPEDLARSAVAQPRHLLET